MSLQRQIATRLVEICLEDGLFVRQPERLDIDEIGDRDLRDSPWFDSMSLVFLQAEIESEWGVHISGTQLAAWLRTLNQIAGYIAQRLPAAGGLPAPGMAEPPACDEQTGR
jgi:acyl carrier protein